MTPSRIKKVKRFSLLLLGLVAFVACGTDNTPPNLEALNDTYTASVGKELLIALRGSDPDGDPIHFKYKADIDIKDRARLDKSAGGNAVFRWTPVASDVGEHAVDFTVTDGTDDTKRTVIVKVQSSTGSASSPVFRQPLGTGTTLDLVLKKCAEVSIEIEDPDSAQVELGEADPKIEGAELTQTGPLTGVWKWCPTASQLEKSTHQVTFTARDGDNDEVTKDFLILLLAGQKCECCGTPPAVVHTPKNESTLLDVKITAEVSDDKGLKTSPILMYSFKDPGAEPRKAQMIPINMKQESGDLKKGVWSVDVPNPVAGKPAGSSAELYYVILTHDNDDPVGNCDHRPLSPSTGSYKITVTTPGGSGGLSPCASCTKDVQCGGKGDTCISIAGENHCGKNCVGGCPSGYTCTTSAVKSVDGVVSKQCIPDSQICGGGPPTCQDDGYEDNDSLSQVKTKPVLQPSTYLLMSCPGKVFDDEDWYPIEISGDTKVVVTLDGTSKTNLDLLIRDSAGKILDKSATSSSKESVTTCLAPGRYYIHVWAWSKGENPYTLKYEKLGACKSVCTDDSKEENDKIADATAISVSGGAQKLPSLQICSEDDDFFKVFMLKDETIHATAKFTQTSYDDDLDLYLYDSKGNNLTPCSELTPSVCDDKNGASPNSNENLTFKIPESGSYYVVVHGWEGSQNSYDLCVDYTSATKTSNGCPKL